MNHAAKPLDIVFMQLRIVANGKLRLRQNKMFQVRLQALHDSIKARHAAELANAGLFRLLVLRWRIASEFRRERRKIEPSPYSLYRSHTSLKIPIE